MRFLPRFGFWARLGRILPPACLLLIVACPARAEKTLPPAPWLACLAKQREALARFELELKTSRYDVQGGTTSASYEQGEQLLQETAALFAEARLSGASIETLAHVVERKARVVFGGAFSLVEDRSELHQRAADLGLYRVWNRREGELSIFDRKGSWHQDANEISLGPVVSTGEIETYLARLGLLLPSEAAPESVPESTDQTEGEAMRWILDLGESRFRFGCRPWAGAGLADTIQEVALWDGKEQGVLEKRAWFRVLPFGPLPNEEPYPAIPAFGIELRYHPNTNLATLALHVIVSFQTDPSRWLDFPRERPPFGWPVLDYRFKPEQEYRFGGG
ncbi:MAG: hypothetical protein HUU16_13940 [Candidatus Omnitrophica bacterium]|nr:hypothetical protein [bacterium]NUN97263.1 hypothetical protein [Candidatus Omnitrophota bacterium]